MLKGRIWLYLMQMFWGNIHTMFDHWLCQLRVTGVASPNICLKCLRIHLRFPGSTATNNAFPNPAGLFSIPVIICNDLGPIKSAISPEELMHLALTGIWQLSVHLSCAPRQCRCSVGFMCFNPRPALMPFSSYGHVFSALVQINFI